MKRALKLTTNVFTVLAAWFAVTGFGYIIAGESLVGLGSIGVGLVFGVIAWGVWVFESRSTPEESRTAEVRFSRHRDESGMFLLFPIGVGALLYFAGTAWLWIAGGVLIAFVLACFAIYEFNIRIVPGDFITLNRGGGYQLAKVRGIFQGDSDDPIYDLILLSHPAEDRPTLDLKSLPRDDDRLLATARMSMSALLDADFAIAAPAHLIVDQELSGQCQTSAGQSSAYWSPPPR